MTTTRIIETAIDDKGDAYVFSDKQQAGWEMLGHTITDLFFSKQSPPDMLMTNEEIENKNFNLKPGQIRFFRSDILPTKALYDNLHPDEKSKDFKDFFYHSTTTVDFIIITKGELVLFVGDKERIVKAGDVVVQRGASHAWHNYTNDIATIMGVMIGAELPRQFKRIDTVQP